METKRGLQPTTIIERTWEGIPGAILNFPVTIALSGKRATEREHMTTLTPEQRAEKLLEFRMQTLTDVLYEAPYLYYLEDLGKALETKQAAALDGAREAAGDELKAEDAARIRRETKLTQEEVDALRLPFPDFPETTPETLNDLAYEYFNQDQDGRKVFQLLIEEVITDYWYWVTPRPTISVSAFMRGK